MVREPHKINGETVGMFCTPENGIGLYLAYRKGRDVFRKKNAWCFDLAFLERIRDDVGFIGVVTGNGKTKKFWITPIEDFFTSPYMVIRKEQTTQRGLPLTRFKTNPYARAEYVTAAVRLR